MKIELKKIKHARNMSEETNAFTADIYVEGEYCGYAKNEGWGGCTNYRAHAKKVLWTKDGYSDADRAKLDRAKALLKKAEDWAKSLPPTETSFKNPDGTAWMMDEDLETVIDEMVQDDLIWQDFKKDCRAGVVVLTDAKLGVIRYKRGMQEWQKQKWIASAEKMENTKVLNNLPKEEVLNIIKK